MAKVVRWLTLIGCLVCFLTDGVTQSATISQPAAPDPHRAHHVGEFEQQQALLLGWDGTSFQVQDTLIRIVKAVRSKLQVIMLVQDEVAEECIRQHLDQYGLPRSAVQFARVPFNSIWARDFGPMSMKTRFGDCWLLDSDYLREAGRPEDDAVPAHIARLLRLPVRNVPLNVEGGNVISNGRGLLLTTTLLFETNPDEPASVIGRLRQSFGADQVAVLEPLFDESTGHVDMFVTFTSPTTVVVGQYDPAIDPINAAALDRNAQLLSGITTPQGKLKVERIPMPPRFGTFVLTYTNVIFANGTLLMPEYPGCDDHYRRFAIKLYQRLLPKWKIVTIDCNELISMGGALHCVAMNLPRADKLAPHKHAEPGLLPPPMFEQIVAEQFRYGDSAVEFVAGAISHRAITNGTPLMPRAQGAIVFTHEDLAAPPPPRQVPLFGHAIFERSTSEPPVFIPPQRASPVLAP